MLTRDEVLQLILYLLVASVLLLASRVRAEPGEMAADKPRGTNTCVATERNIRST